MGVMADRDLRRIIDQDAAAVESERNEWRMIAVPEHISWFKHPRLAEEPMSMWPVFVNDVLVAPLWVDCKTRRPADDAPDPSPCSCGAVMLSWRSWRSVDLRSQVEEAVRDLGSMDMGATAIGDSVRWTVRFSRLPTAPIDQQRDNATEELVALAREGKREEFDALAGCLMPANEIAACWTGTRCRLGLAR